MEKHTMYGVGSLIWATMFMAIAMYYGWLMYSSQTHQYTTLETEIHNLDARFDKHLIVPLPDKVRFECEEVDKRISKLEAEVKELHDKPNTAVDKQP